MSIVVEGVIELPFLDLTDTEGIREVLTLLQDQGLLDLSEWHVEVGNGYIKLTHKERAWSWIEIREGKVRLDEHYKETVKFKDHLLSVLREYYPMFRKALDIIHKNQITNYTLRFDKEKEKLILEVEDDA